MAVGEFLKSNLADNSSLVEQAAFIRGMDEQRYGLFTEALSIQEGLVTKYSPRLAGLHFFGRWGTRIAAMLESRIY